MRSCSVFFPLNVYPKTINRTVMIRKSLLLGLLVLMGTSSSYYYSYTPLLMDRAELESSLAMVNGAMPIVNPGKLCLYGSWVLLVERYGGIHFIDNSNPAAPQRRAFLRVPGCQDVAVRNDVLYVDNAVDMVGFKVDFSTLTGLELTRQKALLPELVSPNGYIPSQYRRRNRPEGSEIVGWLPTSETSNSNSYYYE